jgi:hypothetical protein
MIRPLLATLFVALPLVVRAQGVELAEPPDGKQVYDVEIALEVDGTLRTRALAGAVQSLDLEVRAKHEFRERALPPAGRDAAALRALRHYGVAEARIVVAKNQSSSNLAEDRRTFIADGRPDGVRLHALDFPLSSGEIDLLDVPGDPLAIRGLLPGDTREVGDTWSPPGWAQQMLAGLEALEEGNVRCTLKSVASGIARIDFAGRITGARRGSSVDLDIDGHYLFDTAGGHVSHVELEQRDERTIGPVSPGMKVTAKVTADRRPTANDDGVTAGYARTVPLEPDQRSLLLAHPLPWNAELRLDRSWYVFHQTPQVALLRRMRNGNLIAQCNVRRIEPAAPGRHLAEEKFVEDVSVSLGEQLERITEAKALDAGDDRYVYRVTAVGRNTVGEGDRAEAVPMQWHYYLVAAPSGRQLSFVFVVETALLPQLDGADEAIVRAMRFIDRKAPTRAATNDR